ncbi:unnamed protein product [Amoebophrya sp. A25]|nr:unnamed protein product [Amoebophrya sp. A25]|eukprot:GSA25T00000821001.1
MSTDEKGHSYKSSRPKSGTDKEHRERKHKSDKSDGDREHKDRKYKSEDGGREHRKYRHGEERLRSQEYLDIDPPEIEKKKQPVAFSDDRALRRLDKLLNRGPPPRKVLDAPIIKGSLASLPPEVKYHEYAMNGNRMQYFEGVAHQGNLPVECDTKISKKMKAPQGEKVAKLAEAKQNKTEVEEALVEPAIIVDASKIGEVKPRVGLWNTMMANMTIGGTQSKRTVYVKDAATGKWKLDETAPAPPAAGDNPAATPSPDGAGAGKRTRKSWQENLVPASKAEIPTEIPKREN